MKFPLRAAAAVVAAISLLLPMSAAHAHAVRPIEDQSDNVFTFSYDSSSGQMPRQASSRRINGEDDDVTFTVSVRESEDLGSGLIGVLKLRLNDDHRTIYDGWFTFKVVDSHGNVAFHKARPANVRLYPQPGMRKASLRYRFDVPAGSYKATGSFEV